MANSTDRLTEVEEAVLEHRSLMHLVENVDRLQSEGDADTPRWAAEIASQIDDLSAALIAHFSKEETSALYTTLPERYPDLAPIIDRLRREHREILQRLRELLGRCLGDDVAQRREEISAGVRNTVDQLRQHEAEETEIILWDYTAGHLQEV